MCIVKTKRKRLFKRKGKLIGVEVLEIIIGIMVFLFGIVCFPIIIALLECEDK